MRTIGANIRYYRCLHHLSQEKLADINEKSISAYENDTRIPPIFNLLEIAQALGVTMEQLCGVAGPKTIEDELLDRIRIEVKLVLTEYKIDKIDKILK
jgi:transcriptional regulator with XRE-family HTH domain